MPPRPLTRQAAGWGDEKICSKEIWHVSRNSSGSIARSCGIRTAVRMVSSTLEKASMAASWTITLWPSC